MKFHFKYQQEKKAPSWDPRSKSRELQKKLLRQNPGEGARLGKQLRSKWDQRVKNRKKNIFESGMHPCMLSCSSLTLFNPMDYSPPGSSVHEILQAELLEWVAMPSSRGSSQPGVKTTSLTSNLHWQSGSLPLVPPGKTLNNASEAPMAKDWEKNFIVQKWVAQVEQKPPSPFDIAVRVIKSGPEVAGEVRFGTCITFTCAFALPALPGN